MATKAMDEPVKHRATAIVGDSHYDALAEASKERFGRPNVSAFLRIVIDEWFSKELAAKDGKKK